MVFVGKIQNTLDLFDFGLEKTTDAPLAGDAIIEAIRTCRGMVGLPTDHESTEEPGRSKDKLFRERILTDCYFYETRGYQQWKKNECPVLGEQPTDTFHGGHAYSFFTLADGSFSLANFECSTHDVVFATAGSLSVYLVLRPSKSSQTWPDVEEWELRGPCECWNFNEDAKKQPLQGDVFSPVSRINILLNVLSITCRVGISNVIASVVDEFPRKMSGATTIPCTSISRVSNFKSPLVTLTTLSRPKPESTILPKPAY
ncbi:hypothetical protein ACHAP5_011743 [Fusarium lateritium]